MDIVLLLVFGQLRCQCSFESFCNFTQYSIIIEGIFSIIDYIEQKNTKKLIIKRILYTRSLKHIGCTWVI